MGSRRKDPSPERAYEDRQSCPLPQGERVRRSSLPPACLALTTAQGTSVASRCVLRDRPDASSLVASKTQLRGEINFVNPFNAISAVQLSREKNTFFFSEIMFIYRHPASLRGALRAIVTTREAGMRWTSGLRATNA